MKFRSYLVATFLALLLLPWLLSLTGLSAKLPLEGAALWAYLGS